MTLPLSRKLFKGKAGGCDLRFSPSPPPQTSAHSKRHKHAALELFSRTALTWGREQKSGFYWIFVPGRLAGLQGERRETAPLFPNSARRWAQRPRRPAGAESGGGSARRLQTGACGGNSSPDPRFRHCPVISAALRRPGPQAGRPRHQAVKSTRKIQMPRLYSPGQEVKGFALAFVYLSD